MNNKTKILASGFILLVFGVFLSFILLGKKVEVNAASVVFYGQPYDVHLSHALDEQAIQRGKVYVTDEDGNKVDATVTLSKNQRTLTVENLKIGKYILHIEDKSFRKSSVNLKNQKIEFEVIEKLESIKSVKELEEYFQALLNKHNQNGVKWKFFEEERVEMKQSTEADTASSGGNHSTTNNQVEGIDEGDVVITDGKYIYATVEQQIKIVDAQNPKNLKQVAKIQLKGNGYPHQLMKEGNYLIILLDEFVEDPRNSHKEYYGGKTFTKAAIYDVSDASKPKLVKEFGQEGYMNGVRKYNGVLYIVSNYTPNYWIMKDAEVELRPYIVEDDESNPLEIEKISIIPSSTEPSYTIISAIDLNNLTSKEVNTKGYLGSSSTLYMSKNALYLTAFDYGMAVPLPIDLRVTTSDSEAEKSIAPIHSGEPKTNIYKFAIDGTNIEFTGTGTVKGNVLNQFSMDEHNGYFRIATTEGVAWGNQANSKNHLFILDENLKKVGEVTGLAKGERIYSVRFMGDKAYIVTFKETDPLFVIDTAEPSNPKVLGELKIPGFSNYLHPLDENHLVGIGYDTEQRMDSWSKEPFTVTKGMKISLFDVSDFANPKEQDMVIIGGRGTYSEVQYNHKALFRNEALNYYGFPVILYEEGKNEDVKYKGLGALVYEITTEKGIQLKGNLITPAKANELYEDWESSISRLVYIDDALYTISPKEIKSYDLKTFESIGQMKIK